METVRFVRFSQGTVGLKIVFAPIMIGIARGYFKEFDIALDMIEPSEDYGWLDLVKKNADIGAGYFSFCADPKYYGSIKAVAVLDEHQPGCGFTSLMARPSLIWDEKLTDYASLRGKRIGLLPGRGDDYMAYHGVLTQGGLTLNDVEVLPIPHGGPVRKEALANGTVDVVITRRPRDQFEYVRKGTLLHWRRGFDIFPNQQAQFLLGASDFLLHKQEIGARFFAAYLKGARDVVDAIVYGHNRQAMIDLLVEHTDDSRATIAAMHPVYYKPDGSINLAQLAVDRDALVRQDIMRADVRLEDIVDNHLTENAVASIGRYRRPSDRVNKAAAA